MINLPVGDDELIPSVSTARRTPHRLREGGQFVRKTNQCDAHKCSRIQITHEEETEHRSLFRSLRENELLGVRQDDARMVAKNEHGTPPRLDPICSNIHLVASVAQLVEQLNFGRINEHSDDVIDKNKTKLENFAGCLPCIKIMRLTNREGWFGTHARCFHGRVYAVKLAVARRTLVVQEKTHLSFRTSRQTDSRARTGHPPESVSESMT